MRPLVPRELATLCQRSSWRSSTQYSHAIAISQTAGRTQAPNGRLSLLGSLFRIAAALLQRASLSASHPLTKLRHVEIRSELRAPATVDFGLAADGNLRLKTSSGLLSTLVVHTTAFDADLDQFEFEEEHPIPPARDLIHSPKLTRSIDSSMPQTPPKAANLLPVDMMTALFAPHLASPQSHLNAPLQDA